MTTKEREAIEYLMGTAAIPRDEDNVCHIRREFLRIFTVDVTKEPDYVFRLLETAYNEKNADDLEYAFIVKGNFDLFTKEYPKEYPALLMKLLEEDWHIEHEDIAWIFQKLKLPETVDCLYETTFKRFAYLDYDEFYNLAVKCIWALGDIGTEKAIEKLKLLTQSDNEIIRKNAIYQLERQ